MQDRYIPALTTLIAGAATSIINFMNKVEFFTGLKRLLLVLIIFYIIGLVARAIIVRVTNPIPEDDSEVTDEEADTEVEAEKQTDSE